MSQHNHTKRYSKASRGTSASWAPINASLDQGSYLYLGLLVLSFAPHNLSSLKPLEDPCEHLSQVPLPLLCPHPSRAPTSLRVLSPSPPHHSSQICGPAPSLPSPPRSLLLTHSAPATWVSFIVPPIHQAQSCPGTFAQAVPSTWNAFLLDIPMSDFSSPVKSQLKCHLFSELLPDPQLHAPRPPSFTPYRIPPFALL